MRMAFAAFVAATLMMGGAMADPSLASVFGDSMVLQRDEVIPVWGKADPNESVAVSLAGKTANAKADARGLWMVKLPRMQAGGPHELNVTGADKTLTLKDVLIGDVWICSGQSNMGMSVQDTGRTDEGKKEIAEANYPNIRLFAVMPTTAITPQDELANHSPWAPCTPQSVLGFSAAAYFFGRHVHQKENVPVGLVMTAWGGTCAETWTSKAGLASLPEYAARLKDTEENLPRLAQIEAEHLAQAQGWETQLDAWDAGFQDGVPVWSKPEASAADWKPVDMPLSYAMLAGTNPSKLGGRTWLRRDVDVPASWQGRDLVLNLGLVRETGRVWFNGTEVSRFDLVYRFWDVKTAAIPGSLVKAGSSNTITVLLTDSANMAGMFGDAGTLQLIAKAPDADLKPISVAGSWLMKQGLPLEKLTPRPAPPTYWPNNPNMPTVLYNAMIHPLIRMSIKGAIWYQGESNAGAAYEYRRLFPSLIADWRRAWGQGDFPFLYVQIANFGTWQPVATEPRECPWAELREAQLMTLSVPKTGMAVAIDIGDVNDIHPINKKDVGIRLGLAAQAIAYGEKLEYSGPLYKSMEVKEGKARIAFTHGKGLTVKGAELKGFAVAGQDHKFVYAKAEVQGNEVAVWSDLVETPVAVRYGWDFAPECNLYNAAGLPASPFRTDDWPGVTAPKNKATH